jgi:hypothetical protein
MTQPEALKLADEKRSTMPLSVMLLWGNEAADELRRLHEVNQGLLAAIKWLLADAEDCGGYSLAIHDIARAAIAKGEAK